MKRIEHLECREVVYRVVRRAGDIHQETGQVKPEAFFLRPKTDFRDKETGLSVDLASLRTVEESRASHQKVYRIVTLHTGRVRDLGTESSGGSGPLDVVHEPIDTPGNENPAHCEIVGLPHRDDDPLAAEFLAGELAKQARTVWSRS